MAGYSESGAENRANLRIYGSRFQALVNQAVNAMTDVRPESGTASDIQNQILVKGDTIDYIQRTPVKTKVGAEPNGFGFVPLFLLRIHGGFRADKTAPRNAVFGLHPAEETIFRSIRMPDRLGSYGRTVLVRELELPEAEALVGFAEKPHLDDGTRRGRIFHLNDAEQSVYDAVRLDIAAAPPTKLI